jgi:NAD-dependent dihydropyrimidine dehydrogenase PreA subunit
MVMFLLKKIKHKQEVRCVFAYSQTSLSKIRGSETDCELFDQEKCSICELCVLTCPTRAMEIRPTNQAFFE